MVSMFGQPGEKTSNLESCDERMEHLVAKKTLTWNDFKLQSSQQGVLKVKLRKMKVSNATFT